MWELAIELHRTLMDVHGRRTRGLQNRLRGACLRCPGSVRIPVSWGGEPLRRLRPHPTGPLCVRVTFPAKLGREHLPTG